MSTAFVRTWTVRFGDADPYGIAHYPRIVEAVHETADAFAESVGQPFWELTERGIGLPVAEVDVEFERELRAGDAVTVELDVELGESSVRFDVAGSVDGERAFVGFERRVHVADGEPTCLPADLRAAFAPDGP